LVSQDDKYLVYGLNIESFAEPSQISGRAFYADTFVRLIGSIIPELTKRQQTIFDLYFYCSFTQEEIAQELKIKQPTVSQHLTGKSRHGKKVGGATVKIIKVIQRKAKEEKDPDIRMSYILLSNAMKVHTRRSFRLLINKI